ncbi:MAG TPA: HlyD family efflux transporter periplasmic adaptor subunit [Usitatibacter sp.]|jgi:membrane fusion protein (multidrug efflux system)|nr:HlyD family efflux transporter periplasmic adaptor subunit [Usitatibacter sp.]
MSEEKLEGPAPTPANGRRRKWLTIVMAVFLVGAIGYGLYYALVLNHHESTDDAYVNGNVVQITSQVAGTVVKIDADDTDFVPAGKPLVTLDTADAKVALAQAESQLAKTVRQVRNLYATSSQLQAAVGQHDAELSRAQDDVKRRERLIASGAVSGEEIQHARDALRSAEASSNAARQQLAAQQALVDHTTVEDHPDVKAAAAKVREAYLAYSRTEIPAPVSGYVAKRSVQLGQRVAAGAPLMAVVTLDDVWVDANFKESQLRNMRVGQPAEVTADLYGNKLKYNGTIAGFGAGTGGAFALLPAQNASGNWIKIVQRVPVRVALKREELAQHPLQVGLSMQVKVDTQDQGGDRLPKVAKNTTSDASAVFASHDKAADERVASIIAANDGRNAGRPGATAVLSAKR